jgi:hypothetical protein
MNEYGARSRLLRNRCSRMAATLVACIICSTLALLGSGYADAGTTTAQVFQTGQVFASVGNGTVNVYDSTSGNLLTALNDGTDDPYTAGGAFDADGNYYVTDDLTGGISEYSASGGLLPQFASGLSNPLSLSFDSSGDLYVGQQTTPYVAEFNSSGTRLPDIGPMATELYGVDWIDLASDECTLYYTTEGTDILRYNACTNTQLPNFNLTPLIGSNAYELRILPNGEVLVADSDAVLLLDSSGNLIQTYACSSLPGCAGQLFAVNLDPDGTTFWTGDSYSGDIWQVNIATGQVVQTISTGSGVLYGLTVDGEITVATSAQTVSGPATTPTTLSANSTTGAYDVPALVSAVLTNSDTSSPVPDEPVTLMLNGTETCTATTDDTGTASCSVTPGEPEGTYPLTASFAGDTAQSPSLLASTGSSTFVVTPDPTALTYTGATSAVNGQPATLSGVLTTDVPSAGTALPNQTVVFTLGAGSGAQECSGNTNSSGATSCTIASVIQPNGSLPVTGAFAGTTYYGPSNAAGGVAISTLPAPTTLSVNAGTGEYDVSSRVSAVLTNTATSTPVSGEPVSLTLNGSQNCTGTTNGSGVASCTITPSEPGGTYPLTAAFIGDNTQNPQLLASGGSATFVVTRDPTSLTYTGTTSAVNGQPATLSGVLTTNVPSAGTPLVGQPVLFTLGSGTGAQTCSGTTSSSGSSSCIISSVNQPNGPIPVTVGFSGNAYYSSSIGSSEVAISTVPTPTTLKVNAVGSEYNVVSTVSAVLTNTTTSAPVAGERVTLTLDAKQTCSATTSSSGVASCTITPSEPEGSYPLTGSFGGDTTLNPQLLSSNGSATFVVTPDPTTLAYTGATSAINGQPATLSGVLMTNVPSAGTALAVQPVILTLGSGSSAQSCSGTTNSSGATSCTIASVNQTTDSVPVIASFTGNAYYASSSGASTVTVLTPTTLSVSAGTGGYDVPTTVSALLTNSHTSTAISGEPVILTLNGTQTCSGTTNSTGKASCTITPTEPEGSYPLTASFGGDTTLNPQLLSSNGSATFVVTPDPTLLAYTGATSAGIGQPAILSGVLTTDVPVAGTFLAGQSVTFVLGTGSTAQSCTSTSNSSGAASCTIALVNQSAGSVPVTGSFVGTSYYSPSSAGAKVTVGTATTLNVNAATGGYGVSTTVSATLTNTHTGAVESGQPVTITLDGTQSCSTTTSSSGKASCAITPAESAGTYILTASFAGSTCGSIILAASTGSASFVVTPETTAIKYTGTTSLVNGSSATLSGVLTTNVPSKGTPLAGQTVVFTVGSGSSAQTCSGMTNSLGSASCTVASVKQASGTVIATASYAGNAVYQSSSISANLCGGMSKE